MSLSEVKSTQQLKALQKVFFQIITRPLKPKWRMHRDSRASRMIAPSPTLTPHERLELYAQQYWWRVLDSLREDFPGVLALLGEKRFSLLQVRYLKKCPSRSFTLRNLGRLLPKFLTRDRGLPVKLRRQAAAVAAVEWAEINAFDGVQLPAITTGDLSADISTIELTLQPYVQLLTTPYTVDDFLGVSRKAKLRTDASNVRRNKNATAHRRALQKTMQKRRTALAVYRNGTRLRLARLDDTEWTFAKELQRGGTLPRILGRVLKTQKSVSPQSIQEVFQRFSALGWIAKRATAVRKRSPE